MSRCSFFLATLLLLLACATCFVQQRWPVVQSRGSSESRNAFKFFRLFVTEDPLVLEGVALYLDRQTRPKQNVKVLRNRMQLPFAVQCMRQSYNNVDALDFIAMDQFQRKFFLYRASEWESYKSAYANMMQGDLADPNYFDYISFAQYATIADAMRRGKQQFIERIGADGVNQVVKRNPLIENNDLLPIVHANAVGDALLDYMLNTYPKSIMPDLPLSNATANALAAAASFPSSSSSSSSSIDAKLDDFLRDAHLVLDVFVINSFAAAVDIERLVTNKADPNSMLVSVRVKSPATLWSQQVLRARKDLPVNDFEIKTLSALARRIGLQLDTLSFEVLNGNSFFYICKVSKGSGI